MPLSLHTVFNAGLIEPSVRVFLDKERPVCQPEQRTRTTITMLTDEIGDCLRGVHRVYRREESLALWTNVCGKPSTLTFYIYTYLLYLYLFMFKAHY